MTVPVHGVGSDSSPLSSPSSSDEISGELVTSPSTSPPPSPPHAFRLQIRWTGAGSGDDEASCIDFVNICSSWCWWKNSAANNLASILAMAETVREVLPHVPDEIIFQDLQRTDYVAVTVNNLLNV